MSSFSRYKNSLLFKGFALTTIGSGISKILLALATFIFANELSKSDFGEFSFIRNTLNTIFCICALNFTGLCTKYTIESKDNNASLHKLVILFIFSISICSIVGLIFILSPKQLLTSIFESERLTFYFKIIGFFLPIFMLQPLFEGVLRGFMKFKLIGIVQIITSFIFVITIFIGIKIYNLDGAIIGIVIYYLLYSVILVFCLIHIKPFTNFRHNLSRLWNEKNVIHKSILPIFVMSFMEAPVLWLVQLLLFKFDSMEAVGSMTAICQIRNLFVLIPTYLFNTFISFASKLNLEKQYNVYFRYFSKIGKMLLLLSLIEIIICILFAEPLLGLYGTGYKEDYFELIISSIQLPFLLIIGLYKIDLVVQEHQKQLLYSSIVWNMLWILFFYIAIKFGVSPLSAFFFSQLAAIIVDYVWIKVIFTFDKKRLYEK